MNAMTAREPDRSHRTAVASSAMSGAKRLR